MGHGTVGVSGVHESSGAAHLMTEADERKLWATFRFDPDAGTYLGQWDN